MNTVFNIKNLSYSYGNKINALYDINFEIFKGEILVILGANGSGKSTLLKLIDNLILPDKGEIWAFGTLLNDKIRYDEYEFRKKVGFVFQDSDAQLFNSTVFDEIAFAPLQMGLPKENVKNAVNDIINSFEIEKLASRPPYRLSGGEKKKVALASVIIIKPEVLLLDEPTNGLDPKSKKWLIKKLQLLHKDGTTIVIATHYLEMASMLADRVIIMNEEHSIEIIGEPNTILNNTDLLLKVNLI
ncbi:MAG: energy-coupling factor ABC transporter ATP-binding protein [Thermoanaerobacteraceae bacterium]